MASKRVNIDSTSSASCSKKVKKCKTRYSKEWEKKFDFTQACAKSVMSYENKCHCVFCNADICCAAGGANDVLKLWNALKGENQSKVKTWFCFSFLLHKHPKHPRSQTSFLPFSGLKWKEQKVLDKNGEVAPGRRLMKLNHQNVHICLPVIC